MLRTIEKRRTARWASAGAILLAAAGDGGLYGCRAGPAAVLRDERPAAPTDRLPSATLAGRDLVASREAQSLERAIPLLRDVTRRAPDYAPSACRWPALIPCASSASRDDGTAFPDARFAAKTALRSIPTWPADNRLLGFIDY